MDPLLWSIILLIVGLLLVMLEVFVPSGGLIGFLSVLAVLASIGTAFYNRGPEVGILFLLVAAVAVPAVLVAAFRYWPQTPLGKRVLLQAPNEDEILPDSPQLRTLKALVGKVGVAKSMMLPSGAVSVDGLTVDALSDGAAIEQGQHVRVIEVRANRVVVTPTDEPLTSSKLQSRPNSDDILSQSIESLGLDSMEDPLA